MTTMKYLYVIPHNGYLDGMKIVGKVFIENTLYYVIQGERFFEWKKEVQQKLHFLFSFKIYY